MNRPTEHETVQARILEYASAVGWTFVPRKEAETRRGFDPLAPPGERAKNRSLFFDDLLDTKVREFNPRYAEAEGALLGQFRHLHTDIQTLLARELFEAYPVLPNSIVGVQPLHGSTNRRRTAHESGSRGVCGS